MDDPDTFLADEMLGRLARYLRFLGHDTEYVRGLPDAEILRWVAGSGRRLLTRDQDLARRAGAGTIALASKDIAGQLREVARACPGLHREPVFDRCTLCNGRLAPRAPAEAPCLVPDPGWVPGAPGLRSSTQFACGRCGHLYWEGSHTARVRRDVRAWLDGVPA